MSTLCRCDSFPSIFSHSERVYLGRREGGRGRSPGKIARITDPLGRGSTEGRPPIPHKSQRICQPGENMFGTAALRPPRFSSTMLAGVESSWNLLYESLDWTIFQWLSWPRSGDDFFLLLLFFFSFFLLEKKRKSKICEKFLEFCNPFLPTMMSRDPDQTRTCYS